MATSVRFMFLYVVTLFLGSSAFFGAVFSFTRFEQLHGPFESFVQNGSSRASGNGWGEDVLHFECKQVSSYRQVSLLVCIELRFLFESCELGLARLSRLSAGLG